MRFLISGLPHKQPLPRPLPRSIPLRSPKISMSTTASCFCGAVKVGVSLEGDNLVKTLLCNCLDCHKITASAFSSIFVVKKSGVHFLTGSEDNLTKYVREHGIISGNTMTSSFCTTCGTLMWRVSTGQPGNLLMRIGTVDNKKVANEKLKPQIEIFAPDKFEWLGADVPQWRTGRL
ncbi:Mss4-like protein [Mycena galericulata]|nr:Mss4-like protein [Mycena galericulata]